MGHLDQYGKEIRSNRPITDEIATVENDIFRDYIGNVQMNPDKVIKSEAGGKGIELFEDLLRDAKVSSTLQTRRLAVTGKEWQIAPASDKRDDVKRADYVTQVLKAMNLDAYRRSALSGLVLGFKPAEILWDYSEGDIFIKSVVPKASRRFVFDLQGNLRLLTLGNMVEGEALPDRKFQVFTNPSDNGSPYGDGLGRPLYWPVWFKKNGIKFWLIFSEKFGSPTPWGKYPPGATKEDKQKLLDACEAMQQESAIITPDTMSIQLLEAARQGSINTYKELCDFMDGQIAMVMLGHTGTSQSTPGKLGSEDAAIDIREDYIKSDSDLLCEGENNQLVKWVCDYNFPAPSRNGYPKVWIRTEAETDLKALADRDKIVLVDMGMASRVPERYIEDAYGIPLAREGEAVIGVPQPAQNPFDGRGLIDQTQRDAMNPAPTLMRECSCGRHHDFADNPDQEWVQRYMERLQPMLGKAKKAAIAEIENWLRAQTTPPPIEEFVSQVQGILGASYGVVDTAAIADAVSEIYPMAMSASAPTAKISFGGSDLRAMDFIQNLDGMYVSRWVQNPDAVANVKDFLTQHYFENGADLFGRTSPESIQKFRDLFGQRLGELSDAQIQRIIDTSVQRTRNWAATNQLHRAGVQEIKIVEPTGECDFCSKMNGRTLNVATAYKLMQDHMAMTPDKYDAFLKQNAQDNPPTVANCQNYVDQGMLPPYHPHCHGRVIKKVS